MPTPPTYNFLDLLDGSIMLILSLAQFSEVVVIPLVLIFERKKKNKQYEKEINEERQKLFKWDEELRKKEQKINEYKKTHSKVR